MLYFRVIFISVLLSFVSCIQIDFSKAVENIFGKEQRTTSDLLVEFIRSRKNADLKGKDLPKIFRGQIKHAGDYSFNDFEALTEDMQKSFKKADRIQKTVYTYRSSSRSEEELEYAARCFVFYMFSYLVFELIKQILKMTNSPSYLIFDSGYV